MNQINRDSFSTDERLNLYMILKYAQVELRKNTALAEHEKEKKIKKVTDLINKLMID